MWDIDSGEIMREIERYFIIAIFSPDGRTIASVSAASFRIYIYIYIKNMASLLPLDVHGQNVHTHGQNSGLRDALKPEPEYHVVRLDRPLNAPMSTSEPTPALTPLRKHRVWAKFSPGEDSLSLKSHRDACPVSELQRVI